MKGLLFERMRRAATKLGLGFGNKIRGGWRRSLVSSAAVEKSKVSSESELKSKSLYLCFTEKGRNCDESFTNQVIRRIGFDNGDDADDRKEKVLVETTYERRFNGDTPCSRCTRIGSQIVLPFGAEIRLTHLTLFDVPTSKTESKEFSTPKIAPRVVGIDGKLYCIDMCVPENENYPFEVLENLPWICLDHPPFIDVSRFNSFTASVLEGSKKILGWEPEKPGVYCFDTTKPENGWAESSFSLGNTLPFLPHGENGEPYIFVRDHHPALGYFHLTFVYDPVNSPLVVDFFLMRDECDSFHVIKSEPLHLPKSYKKYTRDPSPWDDERYHHENDDGSYDEPKPFASSDYEFVPLGSRKVCLILNKSFPHDHPRRLLRNVGTLLLVTFEYKIVVTDEPTVKIETRLLRTRRFRYYSGGLGEPGPTQTGVVFMNGAFLL